MKNRKPQGDEKETRMRGDTRSEGMYMHSLFECIHREIVRRLKESQHPNVMYYKALKGKYSKLQYSKSIYLKYKTKETRNNILSTMESK